MALRRLASTRTADLAPLGAAGQRAYELIRREAEALGAEHAALFAEPSPSPQGDLIDWFAESARPPVALSAAPEDEQEAARATLGRLVSDILARAEALSQDPAPEKRRLGEALRNAVEIPGEDSIWLVDGRPVLTSWAHHRNMTAAPKGVLTGFAAAPPPPAPPPPPEPAASAAPEPVAIVAAPARAAGFGWLWWLLWGLTGLAAAAAAWLLIPACGIAGIDWLDRCPRDESRIVSPELERGPALQAELRQLERALALAGRACLPETPPPVERAEAPVCAPDQVARAPSETMILIDASTSMEFGVRSPLALERELMQMAQRGQAGARYDAITRELIEDHGEARIDFVKRALGLALDRAELGPTRLGAFNACGGASISEPFVDEASLRAAIDSVRLNNYTALADAIRLGAAALEGGRTADDPVTIVLISDGLDTCGGDPCAEARKAKDSRPGLSINVVDLTGLPELRCVADETGGSYEARPATIDHALLSRMIESATGAAGVCVEERAEAPPPRPAPPPAPPPSPPEPERAEAPDDFDQRVRREGGTTDAPLTITLIWDNVSDLDLWLTCPDGGRINYRNRSACGGRLDIDQNAERARTREPVENIFFAGAPRPGTYSVRVHNYAQRGAPSNFQLRILKNGAPTVHRGQLSRRGQERVYSFNYP